MPEIVYVSPTGERRSVEAVEGSDVMHAAVGNLVPGIIGECGGEMSCATCHVFVDEEWFDRFPAVTAYEADMLEATAAEPTKFSRLACQLVCTAETSGVIVHLPEEQ
ncbi:2Fe-2S iron-sulfur cluster-binding protein [Nocardia sp. NPDC052278]|uniref:2Fe-2S iron-sulfur cluster-binding protein n=1 Tax=unclassified Nocardia TaxID=2637762 RepID=UPI003697AB42